MSGNKKTRKSYSGACKSWWLTLYNESKYKCKKLFMQQVQRQLSLKSGDIKKMVESLNLNLTSFRHTTRFVIGPFRGMQRKFKITRTVKKTKIEEVNFLYLTAYLLTRLTIARHIYLSMSLVFPGKPSKLKHSFSQNN